MSNNENNVAKPSFKRGAKSFAHKGVEYKEGTFRGFTGDIPIREAEKEEHPSVYWSGNLIAPTLCDVVRKGTKKREPIVIGGWREIVGWFIKQYGEKPCERQATIYSHPEKGVMGFFPHNQKSPTTMTTEEIDEGVPAKERHEKISIIQDAGWEEMGTIHHHCSSGAGQSGVDKSDESTKHGVHITLGKLKEKFLDYHIRGIISVPGEFTPAGKVKRKAITEQYNGFKLRHFLDIPKSTDALTELGFNEEEAMRLIEQSFLMPGKYEHPEGWDCAIRDGYGEMAVVRGGQPGKGSTTGTGKTGGVTGSSTGRAHKLTPTELDQIRSVANNLTHRAKEVKKGETSFLSGIPSPNPTSTNGATRNAGQIILSSPASKAVAEQSVSTRNSIEDLVRAMMGVVGPGCLGKVARFCRSYKDPNAWSPDLWEVCNASRLVMWVHSLTPSELGEEIEKFGMVK